jgi:hypothetical protein
VIGVAFSFLAKNTKYLHQDAKNQWSIMQHLSQENKAGNGSGFAPNTLDR